MSGSVPSSLSVKRLSMSLTYYPGYLPAVQRTAIATSITIAMLRKHSSYFSVAPTALRARRGRLVFSWGSHRPVPASVTPGYCMPGFQPAPGNATILPSCPQRPLGPASLESIRSTMSTGATVHEGILFSRDVPGKLTPPKAGIHKRGPKARLLIAWGDPPDRRLGGEPREQTMGKTVEVSLAAGGPGFRIQASASGRDRIAGWP